MAPGTSSEHGPTTSGLSCIGDTPLIELSAVSAEAAGDVTIYGKMEFVNPTGSVKDRIYRDMIRSAEHRGELTDDMEILECSTGNAGIACAFVGTQRGYDVTVVMPEGMSEERKKLVRAYGGTLVETPGGESDVDTVVTVICDSGQRYFSTELFEEDREMDVPERDHPLDERSRKLLDEYQSDWHVID